MKQVTVAIAGLGGRGAGTYAAMQEKLADKMKIVALADPVEEKLAAAAEKYGVGADMCFATAEEMLERERLADVLFLCTMDKQHHDQAIAAMEKGYDLLLEKPISPDAAECIHIADTAARLGRQVSVCHVLRYTPFYSAVKAQIDSGALGDIVSVQATEQVGFWHQTHSFVRGNWRNSDETSPMILQKSCHDMDILLWLIGKRCVSVSSVGSLTEFRADRAPAGAGERCTDCPIESECIFSALNFYTTNLKNGNTGWPVDIVMMNPTDEGLREKLKTSPYGRCVYRCDNNVVDHQAVQLLMEDGATVSFVMAAFNPGGRDIRIMGTRGMLEGVMNTGKITVRRFEGTGGYKTEEIDSNAGAGDLSGHGGGDIRLVSDFLDIVSGEKTEGGALTSVDRSVESHLVAMAAEKSRVMDGALINMADFEKEVRRGM